MLNIKQLRKKSNKSYLRRVLIVQAKANFECKNDNDDSHTAFFGGRLPDTLVLWWSPD